MSVLNRISLIINSRTGRRLVIFNLFMHNRQIDHVTQSPFPEEQVAHSVAGPRALLMPQLAPRRARIDVIYSTATGASQLTLKTGFKMFKNTKQWGKKPKTKVATMSGVCDRKRNYG